MMAAMTESRDRDRGVLLLLRDHLGGDEPRALSAADVAERMGRDRVEVEESMGRLHAQGCLLLDEEDGAVVGLTPAGTQRVASP